MPIRRICQWCGDEFFIKPFRLRSGRGKRCSKACDQAYRARKKHDFMANVDKGAARGCWEWQGPRSGTGYGRAWDGKAWVNAHRLSYLRYVGLIPPGLFVCHRCDNPRCVNPGHLWVGTAKDNARDAVAKGRQRGTSMKGEAHPQHKLTQAQVREIRQRYRHRLVTGAMLAPAYGVSPGTITAIANRRTWRHVP